MSKKAINIKSESLAIISVIYLMLISFVFITELLKPNSMVYDFSNCVDRIYSTNCIVTQKNGIFTDENGKLFPEQNVIYITLYKERILIYRSDFINSQNVIRTHYGKNGVRKMLQKLNTEILQKSAESGKPGIGAVVIIKPSKHSNLQNLIDILDEMNIAKIGTYTISNNFTAAESKLIASK